MPPVLRHARILEKPSVLPPWGFFHKSTVLIIPLKTSHSVSSFAPKGCFLACKCKHSVNCRPRQDGLSRFCWPQQDRAGMICWHRQNVSCLQIVSGHHPGDITAMFATGLHFLTRTPFFGCQNAEALQKILRLEIFWGFGTRIRPAPGGQYLAHRGGGGAGDGRGRAGEGRGAGG